MATNKTSEMYAYSLEDIQRAALSAIVSACLVQSIGTAGKNTTFASLAEARETYAWATAQLQTQSDFAGNPGGIVRVVSR